jgi:hypothetical protein
MLKLGIIFNHVIITKEVSMGLMGLRVGSKAPDFTLPSHLDREISLRSLRGKYVVMAFFPLAWTPI